MVSSRCLVLQVTGAGNGSSVLGFLVTIVGLVLEMLRRSLAVRESSVVESSGLVY